MSFLSHTKTDKNLLLLTLSVCLMFAAASVLSLAAYTVSASSFPLLLDLNPVAIVAWIPVLALWFGVAWFLEIYFIKLQSHNEDNQLHKILLLVEFLTSGWVGYYIASHLPITYGWFLLISTILMATAATIFQWAMNKNSPSAQQRAWMAVFSLSWISMTFMVSQALYTAWIQLAVLLIICNTILIGIILFYVADSLPRWSTISAKKQTVIFLLIIFSGVVGIFLTPLTEISLLPWSNPLPLTLVSISLTVLFFIMVKYDWIGKSHKLYSANSDNEPIRTL